MKKSTSQQGFTPYHFTRGQSGKGFTLLEVVITIFILTMMLVFYSSSFSVSRVAKLQEHKDIALRVVNQQMATLRAGGYAGLPASGAFTDTQLNALYYASASTSVSAFNGNIKQVTVGVSWVETGSSTLYVGETTLVVNSGGL